MLEIVNVKKNYKIPGAEDVEALKGVSISLRRKEFVAILGPSGCGKTTLLNIIGGLDQYSEGDLIINKHSTKKFADSDWDTYRNNKIGFVFQSYNLISHQSVLANVELSLTLNGVSSVERRRRAKEALDKVGLSDQYNKKPNQMSGGQMQRVAIARALVNNPDIILADEPTGALDSQTSLQVLNILKEISQEKLVVMVTHNQELAQEYASRIIRLKDGLVVSDSKPRSNHEIEIEEGPKPKKTSMSFKTALSLSGKNLLTKKGRTILTAIAGSIGIIGIALILAMSSGFQTYIDKMQEDTLSAYPLQITTESADIKAISGGMSNNLEKFPTSPFINVTKIFERLNNIMHSNKLNYEYVNYLKDNLKAEDYNALLVNNGNDLNIFKELNLEVIDHGVSYTTTNYRFIGNSTSGAGAGIAQSLTGGGTFSEILDNESLVLSQYDILYGSYPAKFNELVLVVNEYNNLMDGTLLSIGLVDMILDQTNGSMGINAPDKYAFEDMINIAKFKLLSNNALYGTSLPFVKKTTKTTAMEFLSSGDAKSIYDNAIDLSVVGILRLKKGITAGSITGTIGYPKALTDFVLGSNLDESATSNDGFGVKSSIYQYVNDPNNKDTNPYTGEAHPIGTLSNEQIRENNLMKLGDPSKVSSISIYPVSYETKDNVKKVLDDFNVNKLAEDQILYIDIMDIMMSAISTAINAITYVLIAFTAVSLVVSSIMIGIITYISVIERTKEIGILRSLGARKKDVSRVFNAETIIIGLTSGIFGVGVTFILTFPINAILSYFVEDIGNIASLQPLHALVLVVISVILNFFAGMLPSGKASKVDPVIALRTE
ncbi:MAG: ABC transporter ATP-binding protein/permease [Acholeplasmatales bacterium]|jgi:putative ABC transport system permease protein|nr:ABC transporter ATP-binding protein/permease [Acholeplasmatales bacterium]